MVINLQPCDNVQNFVTARMWQALLSIVQSGLQAEGILLQQNQKRKQTAHKATALQAAEAVGADNAGHAVSLKAQTRKRQAENETPDAEAALDTQASELQAAVVESRVQDGQEEQDNEPTLEQRVQALHLQQIPAGVASTWLVLTLLKCLGGYTTPANTTLLL